jgi:hypothetical protein
MAGAVNAIQLPDLNFEEHVVGVIVTPPEVLPLLRGFHSREFAIVPMLLSEVNAVSTILVVVPSMVIAAVPIVVPFVMMIVGSHRHGGS